MAEKDKALRALQSQTASSAAGEGDVKKQLQRAQEALKVGVPYLAPFLDILSSSLPKSF